MSAADVPTAVAGPADAGAGAEPDVWARWSDRCNAILVREVQQAVKGRVFVLTVLAALTISVIIAISVAADYERTPRAGSKAFDYGLATLAALVLFVVPMQAYQSMRLELRGGIVEQLLLSRLRPRSILAGKLFAAMVQFSLYVSIMAPLLATSYLLRGVDLQLIATSLMLALVFCVTATSFAVSSAAQSVAPALQPVANIAVAFGLGMATFGMVGLVGSGEYARNMGVLMRRPEFGMVISMIVLGGVASSVLSALTAQCFLLHAFENRSTGFRIMLFAMVPVALGWMLVFIEPAHWEHVFPGIVFFLLMLGTGFGIFMVTEQRELSPRVRAHVPRLAGFGPLAAPFLPGRDRGMACLLLYYALVGAIAWSFWPVASRAGGGVFRPPLGRVAVCLVAYSLVYLTLVKAIRSRLPASLVGNHVARGLLPLLLLAFCLAPVLIDVFAHGTVGEWHVGHVMNPFWTVIEFALHNRHGNEAMPAFVVAIAVAVALQLPSLVRGFDEVAVAAAARRARQAAVAPGSGVG